MIITVNSHLSTITGEICYLYNIYKHERNDNSKNKKR
ncbi:hypothetical protein HMPREF1536_00304 [Parabacteroides gordonii MS-1 = DSM 23371]|uniref:Uncharacterized protein n=1 Tax=Parabacteroides gordonii MS-1 = DSM 23371 TaxID=1203610 RepID=A0A0F5JEE1_9BACT|nr:hypothetical protein HMPREF1536_03371 [Parabacteroides gordonii MS-1 = DSM 23371]KKB60424.1 hypothetical protein HMPREF1536_00304 [Parabacteroides gordonii MS-1 = DSM 23371]